MSGTTVDCIPTAVPNGKNEGGWHRQTEIYFFQMYYVLCLKSTALQRWQAHEGIWQKMRRIIQNWSPIIHVGQLNRR
jgi:hypothetical protein